MIHWFADKLRRFADLIDYDGAPKVMSWKFRFVLNLGIVFDDDPKAPGCQLWIPNKTEYEKAFNGREYFYE